MDDRASIAVVGPTKILVLDDNGGAGRQILEALQQIDGLDVVFVTRDEFQPHLDKAITVSPKLPDGLYDEMLEMEESPGRRMSLMQCYRETILRHKKQRLHHVHGLLKQLWDEDLYYAGYKPKSYQQRIRWMSRLIRLRKAMPSVMKTASFVEHYPGPYDRTIKQVLR